MQGVAEMRSALLPLLLAAVAGCAELSPSIEGRDTTACGRIRFIANGEEVAWGAIFDRPTPELFHVETQTFINRIALAGGGLFTEAIERDGTFCWQLASGRYFISRIYPFQDNVTTADDPGKNVFPGIAFQVDETLRPAYLGTLRIAVSVRRDFMANRRMTSKPSIEILDEFEQDRVMAKEGRGVELEKKLMFQVPGLEGLPFHPRADLPLILRAAPWFLLIPR
jgi:hypothetical protein